MEKIMLRKYYLLDRGFDRFEILEVWDEKVLIEYIPFYAQRALDNNEVSELCELDLRVVGPFGDGLVAQERLVYLTEIPPTEPLIRVEFRDV